MYNSRLTTQVRPEPHFRPRDLKALGYPVDEVVTRFPIFHSLLEILKPIKCQYEQGIQYDMRQYRVYEAEIPTGIALKNKRRKRAKQTELTVSCSLLFICSQAEKGGTTPGLLCCACERSPRRLFTGLERFRRRIQDNFAQGTSGSSSLLRFSLREGVCRGLGPTAQSWKMVSQTR
jgi:hypothetical protein